MKKIKLRKSSMKDSLDTTKKLYESDDFKNNLKDKFWDEELVNEALEKFFEGDYGNLPEYLLKANEKYNKGTGDKLTGIYQSSASGASSPKTDLCIVYSKSNDAISLLTADEYLLKSNVKEIESAEKELENIEARTGEEKGDPAKPELQTNFLNAGTRVLEGYDFANSLKDNPWTQADIDLALQKFLNGEYGKVREDFKEENEERVENQYGNIIGVYSINNSDASTLDDMIVYYSQYDDCIYLLSRGDFKEFKAYWLIGPYKGRMSEKEHKGIREIRTPDEYSQDLVTNPILKKHLSKFLRPGDLIDLDLVIPTNEEKEAGIEPEFIRKLISLREKIALMTLPELKGIPQNEREYLLKYLDNLIELKKKEKERFSRRGVNYKVPEYKLNRYQKEELRNLFKPRRSEAQINKEDKSLDELKDFISHFVTEYLKTDDAGKSALEQEVFDLVKKYESKLPKSKEQTKNIGVIGKIVMKLNEIAKRNSKLPKMVMSEDGPEYEEKALYQDEVDDLIKFFTDIDRKHQENEEEKLDIKTSAEQLKKAYVISKESIKNIKNFIENPEKIKEYNKKLQEKYDEKKKAGKLKKNDKLILIPEDVAAQLKGLAGQIGTSYYEILEKIEEDKQLQHNLVNESINNILNKANDPYFLTEDSKPMNDSIKYVVFLNGEPYVTCDTEDEAYEVETRLYAASNTEEDFQEYYGNYPDVEIKTLSVNDSKVNDFEYYRKHKTPTGSSWKLQEKETKKGPTKFGHMIHRQSTDWNDPDGIYTNWRIVKVSFDLDSTDIDGITKHNKEGDEYKEYTGRVIILGEHYFKNNNSVITETFDTFEFKYNLDDNKFTIFGFTDAFPISERSEIEDYCREEFRNKYLKRGDSSPKDFFKRFGVKSAASKAIGPTASKGVKVILTKEGFDTEKYDKVLCINENDKLTEEYFSDVIKNIDEDGNYQLVRLANGHFAVVNNNGNKIEFIPKSERENYVSATNTPLPKKVYSSSEPAVEEPKSRQELDEERYQKFITKYGEKGSAKIDELLVKLNVNDPSDKISYILSFGKTATAKEIIAALRATLGAKAKPETQAAVEAATVKGTELPKEGQYATKKKDIKYEKIDATDEFKELLDLKRAIIKPSDNPNSEEAAKTKAKLKIEFNEALSNLHNEINGRKWILNYGGKQTISSSNLDSYIQIVALDKHYPTYESFAILNEIEDDKNSSNSEVSEETNTNLSDAIENNGMDENSYEYKAYMAVKDVLNKVETLSKSGKFDLAKMDIFPTKYDFYFMTRALDEALHEARGEKGIIQVAISKVKEASRSLSKNATKLGAYVLDLLNNTNLIAKPRTEEYTPKQMPSDTKYINKLVLQVNNCLKQIEEASDTSKVINYANTKKLRDNNLPVYAEPYLYLLEEIEETKELAEIDGNNPVEAVLNMLNENSLKNFGNKLYNNMFKYFAQEFNQIINYLPINDSKKMKLKDSLTKEEYKEFMELCKKLNLTTMGDVLHFSQEHGDVKDKELLAAMRLAATNLVTDTVDSTKYYLYYIPYNQADGKKIYYVGRSKMTYVFKSEDSGYKPKEVTFDEATKIAESFKNQESHRLYLEDITSGDTISVTDEVPAKYKLCFEGEDTYDMFDETDIDDIYLDKLPEDTTQELAIKSKLKEVAKKIYQSRQGQVNADNYEIEFTDVYITEDGKYVQSILNGYLPLKTRLKNK